MMFIQIDDLQLKITIGCFGQSTCKDTATRIIPTHVTRSYCGRTDEFPLIAVNTFETRKAHHHADKAAEARVRISNKHVCKV